MSPCEDMTEAAYRMYPGAMLDVLHLRSCPAAGLGLFVLLPTAPTAASLPCPAAVSHHRVQPAGACAYVTWLCGCLNDPRIANPDVQESLLQVRDGGNSCHKSWTRGWRTMGAGMG